ncbi:MAG: hypothetical protein Q7W51_07275 [Coriobacteriia bacterium]|nr:hypothetical protein [Coriobacteriia bacterium]
MSAQRRLTFVVLLGALLIFALGASSAFGAVVLADSYSETNLSAVMAVSDFNYPQLGQSFTAIAGTLDSAAFPLSGTDASSGNAYALLYAHSETFGTTGVPSGPPLATSSPVDVTTIPTAGGYHLITFDFDNTVLLAAGEKYMIALQYSGSATDRLWCGIDNTTPTHPGNFAYIQGGIWQPVSSYDAPFYVYQTPPAPVPVYRFFNRTNGTHFYTDSAAERDMVNATWPHIFTDEGPTYYTYPANNSTQLTRLYNMVAGSHFYTADAAEAANALATWPNVFRLDGATYKVNPAPVANSLPVYRFFNVVNGSHFYTSSETEKAHVLATWPHIYTLEGPAFWIGL